MKTAIAAALLGATLLAGTAHAQDAAQERPRWDPLERLDTNHDGVISKDEILADVDARFAKMDANHDGKITPEERKAFEDARRAEMEARRAQMHPGGPGGRMGRMDANGDGVVTLDEERARATERFDRMDTNHDGKIDQSERDAMRARMMGGMRRHGPMGDGPPPPPPAGAPSAPSGN